MTDERTLVKRAQAGDREAFGALYETYLTPIHDFCYRMLRNRADAEDVTAETFLKAVERLSSLKDPDAFKGWIYSIARNASLSLIESRKRATPVAEHFEAARTLDEPAVPQPEAHAEQEEWNALLWDAAAALNPRDYSVFELSVRHGLSSKEIAQAMDVRPAYAYILVNRLKGSVNESLDAVLLSRAAECPDLEEVLAAYPAEVSPRMRKAVMRHAKACAVCGETRKRRGAVALLQGTAWAQPAPAFAAELSRHIDERWAAEPTAAGTGAASGASGALHTAGMSLLGALLVGGLVSLAAQNTIVPDEVTVQPAVAETTPSPEPADPPSDPAPDPAPGGVPTARTPVPEPEEGDVRIVIVDEGGQEGVTVTEGEERTDRDRTDPSTPTPDPQPPRDREEPEQDDGQQTYPPLG